MIEQRTTELLPWRIKDIPNTADGRAFIRVLRMQAKKQGFFVKLRGRGHRRGIRRFRQELPHVYATHFVAYIITR
jgi:hypothetical protein